MTCEFSESINLGTEELPDWEFSVIECGLSSTTEKIVNLDYPTREFFVEKTFSYGDALIIFFLTLFFIFTIAKGVFNFFWKK